MMMMMMDDDDDDHLVGDDNESKPRSLQVDAYSLEENEFYVDRDPGDDFIDLQYFIGPS